eukprot:658566-Hanusia_phi.AAC.1
MNIVVAVLLDEFISTVEREKCEKKAKQQDDIVSSSAARGGGAENLLVVAEGTGEVVQSARVDRPAGDKSDGLHDA